MNVRLYVFFDSVRVETGPIYQWKNDSEALRQFDYAMERLANDDKAVAEPEHIKLLYIGEFNSEEGTGSFLETPKQVIANINLEDD